MTDAATYARQSDPLLNPAFRRRWSDRAPVPPAAVPTLRAIRMHLEDAVASRRVGDHGGRGDARRPRAGGPEGDRMTAVAPNPRRALPPQAEPFAQVTATSTWLFLYAMHERRARDFEREGDHRAAELEHLRAADLRAALRKITS